MPKDERVLLLLLGYAANQLSMFQKLLSFAAHRTTDTEVVQHAEAVQTQMLLRLMVGALNEAWKLVRTRFIENPLSKDYIDRLEPAGRQALEALKNQFRGESFINVVRNTYGFHFPTSDETEVAFEAALKDHDSDDLWSLYFSQHGFNCLFLLSDLIVLHGISKKMRAADLVETQRKLMGEVTAASANMFDFTKAFVAAAWLKNFGEEMVAQDIVTVGDAPNIGQVRLPFFVEVPSDEQPGGRDA